MKAKSLGLLFRALRRRYLLYPEPAPRINSIRIIPPARTHAELAWTALNGRTYRLYCRDSLSTPWNAFCDYTGTGDTTTAAEALGSAMRLYRLELLP